jgi:hypothetical protein
MRRAQGLTRNAHCLLSQNNRKRRAVALVSSRFVSQIATLSSSRNYLSPLVQLHRNNLTGRGGAQGFGRAGPLDRSVLEIDFVRTVIIAQNWFTCEILSVEARSDHGPEESIVQLISSQWETFICHHSQRCAVCVRAKQRYVRATAAAVSVIHLRHKDRY